MLVDIPSPPCQIKIMRKIRIDDNAAFPFPTLTSRAKVIAKTVVGSLLTLFAVIVVGNYFAEAPDALSVIHSRKNRLRVWA
jgi:hypothetical protein